MCKKNSVHEYETPQVELVGLVTEGMLCASEVELNFDDWLEEEL